MTPSAFFRPAYSTAYEKRRDLWVGVIGLFAVNFAFLVVLLAGLVPAWGGATSTCCKMSS